MQPATRFRPAPLGLIADRTLPRLYDKIVEALRDRHNSRRTEEAYLRRTRRYIEFRDRQHIRELAHGEIAVRDRKGDKDWVRLMPPGVIRPLHEHLRQVQIIHHRNLADCYGHVELSRPIP